MAGRQRDSCSLDNIEGLITWLKKRAPQMVVWKPAMSAEPPRRWPTRVAAGQPAPDSRLQASGSAGQEQCA